MTDSSEKVVIPSNENALEIYAFQRLDGTDFSPISLERGKKLGYRLWVNYRDYERLLERVKELERGNETRECRTDSRLAGDIEYCLAKINQATDVHAVLTQVMLDLRTPAQKVAAETGGGLLRKPSTHAPPGCHCQDRCMAPVVMGRQTPCRDPEKAARLALKAFSCVHIWSVKGPPRDPEPEQLCDNGCGLKWKDRTSQGKGE